MYRGFRPTHINCVEKVWDGFHFANTSQTLFELIDSARYSQRFLLRKQVQFAFVLTALELSELVDATSDRLPIRKRAAQPTHVDIRHATPPGFQLDCFLSLALCAQKEDISSSCNSIADQGICFYQRIERLLKVNDVNVISFRENKGPHPGIPLSSPVPEMNPSFKQVLHAHGDHISSSNPVSRCKYACTGADYPRAQSLPPGRERTWAGAVAVYHTR